MRTTIEFDKVPTTRIEVNWVGGRKKVEMNAPFEFIADLNRIGRSPADVDLVTPNKPDQKAGLANDFSRSPDQTINISGRHITAHALIGILLGHADRKFTRFKKEIVDRHTKLPTILYYLPVVDNQDGRVVLLRLDLETLGILRDIALKHTSQPIPESNPISDESRLLVPPGFNQEKTTFYDSDFAGGPRNTPIEAASGSLQLGTVSFSVETASSVGDRAGKDEDIVSLRKYQLPDGTDFIHAAVYDGMGGQGNGDVASLLACRAAQTFLSSLTPNSSEWNSIIGEAKRKNEPPQYEITRRCLAAQNEAVYNFNQGSDPPGESGSTVVQAFIYDRGGGESQVISASSGDSRLYRRRGGTYHRMTADHSFVDRLVAIGQISGNEIHSHPQRNIVYGGLGQKPVLEHKEIRQMSLNPGEELVLTCDGFWEAIQCSSGGKISNDGSPKNETDFDSPQMKTVITGTAFTAASATARLEKVIQMRPGDNISYLRILRQ